MIDFSHFWSSFPIMKFHCYSSKSKRCEKKFEIHMNRLQYQNMSKLDDEIAIELRKLFDKWFDRLKRPVNSFMNDSIKKQNILCDFFFSTFIRWWNERLFHYDKSSNDEWKDRISFNEIVLSFIKSLMCIVKLVISFSLIINECKNTCWTYRYQCFVRFKSWWNQSKFHFPWLIHRLILFNYHFQRPRFISLTKSLDMFSYWKRPFVCFSPGEDKQNRDEENKSIETSTNDDNYFPFN